MKSLILLALAMLGVGTVASAAVPSVIFSPLYLRYLPAGVEVAPEVLAWDRPMVGFLAPLPLIDVSKPSKAKPGITVVQVVNPQPGPAPIPPSKDQALQRRNGASGVAWMVKHKDLRESHGYNRNPLIDSWARACGNALGSEWCGLTQWASQKERGLSWPKGPAGSYNWFSDPVRTHYIRGKRGSADSIKVGHMIGIYNAKKGRVAHITRAALIVRNDVKSRPPRSIWCWGGNEGSGQKAGVHYTNYPLPGIYAASNYNYNYK